MRQLIKRLIPPRLISSLQRIYWSYSNKSSRTKFTMEQYNSLTALKCIVSYNKYGGYCVPESSRYRPAARKVLLNDVYEPKTIEFILANCRNGDIVHAGTYFGDFLPALSKGCAPKATIWAFEPNPENHRCANITLQINDIGNVVLTNAGLGAKNESLLMRTIDESGQSLGGGSRIIGKDQEKVPGAETVQIVEIDDMVDSDRLISIVQLDVEGHEKEALSGALKTVRRCLPILILEVLPDSSLLDSEWFSENILNLGYRKTSTIHGNSVFQCNSRD